MIIMFKLFEIKEGKLKVLPILSKRKFKGFLLSSILLLIIAGVSGWLKIDENELFKLYNAIINHFGMQYDVPQEHKERVLDSKVETEVDNAIKEYQDLTGDDGKVRIQGPTYVEEEAKPENQTGDAGLLGGPMRLCAPWLDDCPKE